MPFLFFTATSHLKFRRIRACGYVDMFCRMFQTHRNMRFSFCLLRRILGLESYPSRIEYSGRLISVSICPMGIHPEAFEMTPEIG